MRLLPCVVRAGLVGSLALMLAASGALGQRPNEAVADGQARLARRGAGFRVSSWNVEDPTQADAQFSNSLHFEGYLQRGLDSHLVLETSVGVWRRVTRAQQQLPTGSDTVETKVYVIPLLTSLKLFPLTTPANPLEPYIMGAIGFALGVENQAPNAIGGGGTSIVTGFGFRAASGLEIHPTSTLGLAGGVRYQWMKLSEDLGLESIFRGFGLEGAITFRFAF